MKKLKYEKTTNLEMPLVDFVSRKDEEMAFSLLPFFDRCNSTQKSIKGKRAIERLSISLNGEKSVVVEISIEKNNLSWTVGVHPKYQSNDAVLGKINGVFKIALGENIIDKFK